MPSPLMRSHSSNLSIISLAHEMSNTTVSEATREATELLEKLSGPTSTGRPEKQAPAPAYEREDNPLEHSNRDLRRTFLTVLGDSF